MHTITQVSSANHFALTTCCKCLTSRRCGGCKLEYGPALLVCRSGIRRSIPNLCVFASLVSLQTYSLSVTLLKDFHSNCLDVCRQAKPWLKGRKKKQLQTPNFVKAPATVDRRTPASTDSGPRSGGKKAKADRQLKQPQTKRQQRDGASHPTAVIAAPAAAAAVAEAAGGDDSALDDSDVESGGAIIHAIVLPGRGSFTTKRRALMIPLHHIIAPSGWANKAANRCVNERQSHQVSTMFQYVSSPDAAFGVVHRIQRCALQEHCFTNLGRII